MTKTTLRTALLWLVAISISVPALAQTATTQTTLSAAITSSSAQTMRVASATGFTANTTYAMIDKEIVGVTAVSGTVISITRGASGTQAVTHASGAVVYVGPVQACAARGFSGSCTATAQTYLPILTPDGNAWYCNNSIWTAVPFVRVGMTVPVTNVPVSGYGYTIKPTDYLLAITSLGASITLTLPSATGMAGHVFIIKDMVGSGGSYTITVAGTIDGTTNTSLTGKNWVVLRLVSNGSNWFAW